MRGNGVNGTAGKNNTGNGIGNASGDGSRMLKRAGGDNSRMLQRASGMMQRASELEGFQLLLPFRT
jgi:hypothetical protein